MNSIWKSYYGNTNQNYLFSTGSGQSECAPRLFNIEDVTKTFTSNDAEYTMGCNKVLFTRFSMSKDHVVRCGNRPNLEKAAFDPFGGIRPD